ncbi:MAG: hypothetical protein AVDCRST_MAG69-2545, partial [uncultured Solirubrobacteraceae bacterium]
AAAVGCPDPRVARGRRGGGTRIGARPRGEGRSHGDDDLPLRGHSRARLRGPLRPAQLRVLGGGIEGDPALGHHLPGEGDVVSSHVPGRPAAGARLHHRARSRCAAPADAAGAGLADRRRPRHARAGAQGRRHGGVDHRGARRGRGREAPQSHPGQDRPAAQRRVPAPAQAACRGRL